MAITYKSAGVDIDAGESLVERIKPMTRSTQRPEVLGGIGGLGEHRSHAQHCQRPGRGLQRAAAADRPLGQEGTDPVVLLAHGHLLREPRRDTHVGRLPAWIACVPSPTLRHREPSSDVRASVQGRTCVFGTPIQPTAGR